ncbi:MAG: hypothetical protein IPL53_12210 [Ignavibacteria bacterium]|nr:hypothetical protein [Ignavibacteria bacterium]
MTSIYGTYLNYNNNFKNNDYRKVISYIENNFNPGDGIIVEPHFMGWSINYHLKHSNSNLKEPDILGWDLNMQLNSLKEKTDLNKLWFVLDYSALGQNNYDSLPALMSELGYKRENEKSFYIIPAKVNVEYYVKSF